MAKGNRSMVNASAAAPDAAPVMPRRAEDDALMDTRRNFKAVVYAWVCAGVLALFYLALYFSGGTGQTPGYSVLADAFMRGQTYLTEDPMPELLALSDPYEPSLNARYIVRDTSLYNGHLYWYFGPFPAVVLVGVKLFLGNPTTFIYDGTLVISFCLLLLVTQTLLVIRLRRLFFPRSAAWTIVPIMSAVALTLPITWLTAHAGMLEAAISGGQCCLMIGFHAALTALGGGSLGRWKLLLAGTAWGAAITCRLSLLPAVAVIVLLTLLALFASFRGRAALAILRPGNGRPACADWHDSAGARRVQSRAVWQLDADGLGLSTRLDEPSRPCRQRNPHFAAMDHSKSVSVSAGVANSAGPFSLSDAARDGTGCSGILTRLPSTPLRRRPACCGRCPSAGFLWRRSCGETIRPLK